MSATLSLKNIDRSYGDLKILEGADLQVKPGEIVGLLGPSGSGKSSLLHIAALLEKPTGGDVLLNGQHANMLPEKEQTLLRRHEVGFVYQFHHLLPEFSALLNVALPQVIAGVGRAEAETRAKNLLKAMGLEARMSHQPAQLSGGEKQRVAIARALANKPALLLADEPTGNLDVETSAKVFDQLLQLAKGEKLAALIATHDRALAAKMDRVVTIENHKLVPVSLD